MSISRRSNFKLLLVIVVVNVFIIGVYFWSTTRLILRDLTYLSRPIWDVSGRPQPWTVIPHYDASGIPLERLCSYHSWTARDPNSRRPKIIDAIIFSVELDILEIRLKELWPVVDQFVVLEADRTFTGVRKPLVLRDSLHLFDWAKDKLRVESYTGLSELSAGESPFRNENAMRKQMSRIVGQFVERGDLVLCSDVDEIPSARTLALLGACTGYPDLIHLQLKTYVYSFEFFFSLDDSWRAHVVVYNGSGFAYQHGRLSDHLLAGAGWHCTFCFRRIADFQFKMTSYSHNDRVTSERLLEPSEIQRKVCAGEDVFDMLPEAYTFRELFAKMGAIPRSTSLTDLPAYALENRERFAFLMPGGCVREDAPQFGSSLATNSSVT